MTPGETSGWGHVNASGIDTRKIKVGDHVEGHNKSGKASGVVTEHGQHGIGVEWKQEGSPFPKGTSIPHANVTGHRAKGDLTENRGARLAQKAPAARTKAEQDYLRGKASQSTPSGQAAIGRMLDQISKLPPKA